MPDGSRGPRSSGRNNRARGRNQAGGEGNIRARVVHHVRLVNPFRCSSLSGLVVDDELYCPNALSAWGKRGTAPLFARAAGALIHPGPVQPDLLCRQKNPGGIRIIGVLSRVKTPGDRGAKSMWSLSSARRIQFGAVDPNIHRRSLIREPPRLKPGVVVR